MLKNNRQAKNYLTITGNYEDAYFDDKIKLFIKTKLQKDFSLANKYEFFYWYNNLKATKEIPENIFLLDERVIRHWHKNKDNKTYYSFEVFHWKQLILFMKSYNLQRITSEKGVLWYLERTYADFSVKDQQVQLTESPKVIIYENKSNLPNE